MRGAAARPIALVYVGTYVVARDLAAVDCDRIDPYVGRSMVASRLRPWLAAAVLGPLACTSSGTTPESNTTSATDDGTADGGTADGDTQVGPTSTSGGPGGPATQTSGDASTGPGAGSDETGGPPLPPPSLEGVELVCKLVNDASVEDQSLNETHTRFNLRGTDLGIPVVIGDLLHIFFGDTHGYRDIWAIGEDPDSVAFVDVAAAQADPSVLCTDLSFYVTPDIPSVAAGTDPAIERDFAAGWMLPPPGEDLSSYITHHPAAFPNVPGSFEVPSGAVTVGDDVYLLWAGKSEFEPYARMTVSYLARWDEPRDLPIYQIVRPLDSLYDGPLGGHFLQVFPIVDDDMLYLFGTGDYRRSPIYLARMPVDAIETGVGQQVYDPIERQWLDASALDPKSAAAIEPIVQGTGIGELGGAFVAGPDTLVLMYQEATWDGAQLLTNRIYVTTAPTPEGPWSDPLVVIDMADPQFLEDHCCLAQPCGASQIWECASAGLYGAYPLPIGAATDRGDGTYAVDLPFLVSTWIPYNVVLFEAHLVIPQTSAGA